MNTYDFFTTFYPRVEFVPCFKVVYAPDAAPFRSGVRFGVDYDMFELLDNFEGFQKKGLAWLSRYHDEFKRLTGREMVPEDIRVAFAPVCSSFVVTFVDDVSEDSPAHCLVETSAGNFQAHVLLDRPVSSDDDMNDLMRALCADYGADVGAKKPRQARRVPIPGMRTFINMDLPKLNVDTLIQRGRDMRAQKEAADAAIRASRVQRVLDSAPPSSEYRLDATFLNDLWNNKYRKLRVLDRSTADLYFTQYLVSRGYTLDEVYEALLIASPEIRVRKAGHLEHYITSRYYAAGGA